MFLILNLTMDPAFKEFLKIEKTFLSNIQKITKKIILLKFIQ